MQCHQQFRYAQEVLGVAQGSLRQGDQKHGKDSSTRGARSVGDDQSDEKADREAEQEQDEIGMEPRHHTSVEGQAR